MNFIDNCLNAVWLTLSVEDNQADEVYESLKIVWFSKTLQNHKALVMSTSGYFNETYWEVTYNGDKDEYYVDEYIKTSNEVISGDDIETM
jgi:hypothetical protein|nr:MAG TPA: hypothetical protein [Caudoviricetes sp.]